MKKEKAIAALAALAQESRLDVFRMLVQSGPDGLPAGEIGAKLGVPSPTLSFHLNHLKHAGLVSCRRDSRSIIYSADYKAMNDLISYMMENCCRGNADQCAPAACKPARETNVKPRLRNVGDRKKRKGERMKRMHIHVAVKEIPESVKFYSTMFGVEPSVVKPDYAKWMLDDPRVNFAVSTFGQATPASITWESRSRVPTNCARLPDA